MKNQISKTLYALRAVNKMSSKEVAHKLGISQSQYSKLETGEKEISLQKLEKIAAVFNMDLEELLRLILKNNGTYKHPPSISVQNIQLADEAASMVDLEHIFQPKIVEIYRTYLNVLNENNIARI